VTRRAVIVHSLDHALAALAAADGLGVAVTLRSAPGAAAYLGASVFRDMVAEAALRFPGVPLAAVLDCGGDPGLALNALRQGIKALRLDAPRDVRRRVADIAAQKGAVLDEDLGPALDLFAVDDAEATCRAWLAAVD
jgi:fructose/tagatose bisphosphate aldolase